MTERGIDPFRGATTTPSLLMPPPPRPKPTRSAPPPLPRGAASTMRARGSPHRKPLRVEFLPDELVEHDVGEFVPDEFVLDDVATDSSVGFAAPSDAPPPHPATQQPFTRSWRPQARATGRAKGSVRLGWIATALASVFGLVAIARLNSVAATHSGAPPSRAMIPPPAAPSDTTTTHDPSKVTMPTSPSAMSAAPASSGLSVSPSAAAEGPAASSPSAADGVDLKHRAQQALEKGRLTAALDLGQQAVEADPTDAESWLILGATYLQRGKPKEARRCFASCVDQATQGPVSECKALLR